MFHGVALKFNSHAFLDDGRTESFDPGAFDACLAKKPNILILVDHEPVPLLAMTGAGTARVHADRTALHVEMDVQDFYRDQVKQARGLSITFVAKRESSILGGRFRTIHEAELKSISVCCKKEPAYLLTWLKEKPRG